VRAAVQLRRASWPAWGLSNRRHLSQVEKSAGEEKASNRTRRMEESCQDS
jgi:hypothetical protein